MARSKRVIEVEAPAEGSFDPTRPLSKNTLLLNQVRHFQRVERELMTEGEAAEYIERVTARLHLRTKTTGGKRTE